MSRTEQRAQVKSEIHRGHLMAISTRINSLLERARTSALAGVVAMASVATAQSLQAENGSPSRGTEQTSAGAENARVAPARSFFASERSSPWAAAPESRLSGQPGGGLVTQGENRPWQRAVSPLD